MEPINEIRSRTVVLPNDDIDTDQIIPARFLTTTTKQGLGKNLFNDWRYDKDGREVATFALNKQPRTAARPCSSPATTSAAAVARASSLLDFGIRRGSTAIADIFRQLAERLGARVDRWLLDNPGAEVRVDLETTTLEATGKRVAFPIDRFSRYCLMNGIDQLGYLLERRDAITRFEQAHA